jgi:glycosyltransferase involved in cell wall biosynthesis
MKVLHLLDSVNRGGAEVLALDVCRNAKQNGLDLSFLATGEGSLFEDFKNSGVDFYYFKRKFPIDFGVIRKLRKLLKKKEIDVVHTHQSVEGIHAYFATIGTKTKLVLTHHGFIPDRKNLFALKFLLPKVSSNVVVSKALLSWYESETSLRFPKKNTKIIYNGVDEKRLQIAEKTLKKELGLTENDLLFGMIANFYNAPRKDQITVCQALPKVFAEKENAYFAFVGGYKDAKNYYEECKKLCKINGLDKRVFFLGIREDIPNVLNSIDIFVLSSLHEGMPISILEAMLAKIPCVLSDIKPNLEISKNGEFAEIFQTQNADDLAEKILKIIDKKEILAEKAKLFASQNYEIKAHIDKLKMFYESLIQ